jgi:hypothetical protein
VPRRVSPRSLANLTRDGRPQAWGAPKRARRVTVTDEGWQGCQAAAEAAGAASVSDLLERIGRGLIVVRPA